jgi:tRNA-specific 2-thiouridylase
MVFNAEKPFKENVIRDFISEYEAGRTPNPCVRCNTFLKFGFLPDMAKTLGISLVATGHYAQIRDHRLFKAEDPDKDQSYFLYTLNAGNIGKVLFPVGGYRKSEVRALARELRLPVHDKKESQDICFVPRGKYREFLENNGVKSVKGFMFSTRGNLAGEHEGLYRYTIGQRKGLGPQGKRAYVLAMDPAANSITIGEKADLLSSGVELNEVNFVATPAKPGEKFEIRLRYRGAAKPGTLMMMEGSRMKVRFDSPAESVAPGQSAVLYKDNEVIGGGIILRGLAKVDFPG